MKKLSPGFEEKIKARILEVEAITSADFVVAVRDRASPYRMERWLAVFFAVVFEALFQVVRPFDDWRLGLSWALGLGLLVWLVTALPAVLKRLVPRHHMLREVEREARLAFLHHEVFATRSRTGILILISEFERAAYILADRGFAKAVRDHEWAELGAKLAHDLGKQSTAETFLEALDELGKKLAPLFPSHPDKKHELAPEVTYD